MMKEENMMEKFRSRKWRLTLMILLIAVVFSGCEILTSELSNILTALGVSYNAGQGIVDWQKAKSETNMAS